MKHEDLIKMELTIIKASVQRIEAILANQGPDLDHGSDRLDHDQMIRSNQSDLDQIDPHTRARTDQPKDDKLGWSNKEVFEGICSQYGIDLSRVDLSGVGRNIDWIVANISKIQSPKNYIGKMISQCPAIKEKVIGFTQDPEKDLTIMGLNPADVEEKIPYFDYRTYSQIRNKLPQSRHLFVSYDKILESDMQTRVAVAYCIKEGLL